MPEDMMAFRESLFKVTKYSNTQARRSRLAGKDSNVHGFRRSATEQV
jgi:hypothetical protein